MEVLIAMAIFSVGILAIFSMQITATNSNALARNITENNTAAADKVEELMALAYDDPLLDVGEHSIAQGNVSPDADGIDNDGDGLVDETGETGYVAVSWTVFPEIQVWDQPVKPVRVTVTTGLMKRDGKTDQKEITLEFFKTDM
jgi:hypothetical protein